MGGRSSTREAGHYVIDVNSIAAQLKLWVAEKKQNGLIADIPATALTGLARDDQFQKLEECLHSCGLGQLGR